MGLKDIAGILTSIFALAEYSKFWFSEKKVYFRKVKTTNLEQSANPALKESNKCH